MSPKLQNGKSIFKNVLKSFYLNSDMNAFVQRAIHYFFV